MQTRRLNSINICKLARARSVRKSYNSSNKSFFKLILVTNIMMKFFVAILSMFAIFKMATCKAIDPTPVDDITRDIRVVLPGNERIDKRSAEDFIGISTAILPDISSEDDNQQNGDYSADYGGPSGELEALNSNEDFALAESSIVFHPLFVSRQRSLNKNRVSRSVGGIQNRVNNNDELEVSENGMVFLPLFRSKNQYSERQRLRRSVEDVPDKTKKSSDVTDTDENLRGDEDLMFKPSFRRKSRHVRSVSVMKNDLVDGMAVAENGLIFRPVFRTRQGAAGSA